MISAVIVAGGSGQRMGGRIRKQYLPLCGRPVLAWTLEAVMDAGLADVVFLVAPPDETGFCRERVTDPMGLGDRVRIVGGGRDRQASVYQGLLACPPETRVVVVHDGVRPFLTRAMLEDCIDGADRWGGSVTAVPSVDTLKQVDGHGRVLATIDRSSVRLAQTPQAFRYPLLLEAHESAVRDGIRGTDDAQLVERIGGEVHIVAGSGRNIKLTRPTDLLIAEAILKGVDDPLNIDG